MPRGRGAASDRLRAGDAGGNRVAARSTIDVDPLSGALGAVASGVDLAAPSDADIRAIHRTLLGHGVLFFRDQPLTTTSISRWPPASANRRSSRSSSGSSVPGTHSDTSPTPPRARPMPTAGTRTSPGSSIRPRWRSSRRSASRSVAATPCGRTSTPPCDALSPPMQALCRRLSVVHTVSPVIVDAFRARAGDDLAGEGHGGVPARRASAGAHPSGDRDATRCSSPARS